VFGIVHRDLKPGNVFFAESSGSWKVLDFGIAKLSGAGTLTENQIVGTPGYMAPEQASGDGGDGRSDVFSLGAVAYRVLTGRAPFTGNPTHVLHAVLSENPARPSALAPELSPDVERVLAVALAKRPSDRFPRAGDFARALARAADEGLTDDERAAADALVAERPWSA
jgi:serine/threonine-protein kinase